MGTEAEGKAAFDAIYEKNMNSVYHAALRYSGNHHAAEDITQTVFMKFYKNMDHVNLKAANSWLLTAAKNTALNYKRDMCREVPQDEIEYDIQGEAAVGISLEDDFIRRLSAGANIELTENIFADLYRVNPRWYDAVTITYLLEKPQKEVAEIMGVKPEVLHSMLYRARNWIKKKYRKQFDHLHDK